MITAKEQWKRNNPPHRGVGSCHRADRPYLPRRAVFSSISTVRSALKRIHQSAPPRGRADGRAGIRNFLPTGGGASQPGPDSGEAPSASQMVAHPGTKKPLVGPTLTGTHAHPATPGILPAAPGRPKTTTHAKPCRTQHMTPEIRETPKNAVAHAAVKTDGIKAVTRRTGARNPAATIADQTAANSRIAAKARAAKVAKAAPKAARMSVPHESTPLPS